MRVVTMHKHMYSSAEIRASRQRHDRETLNVLSHHDSLQASLQSVTSMVVASASDTEQHQLIDSIRAMQKNLDGICHYLSHKIPPQYYCERKTAGSTIAEQVLSVPELFERIMIQAELQDVLNICQVSRNFQAMVKGSPRLQIRLHYKADPSAKMQPNTFAIDLPFIGRADLNMMVMKGFRGRPAYLHSSFWLRDRGTKLPTMGESWRRMLISQPPTHEIKFNLHCTVPHGLLRPETTISSPTGITLGELREALATFISAHTPCAGCKQHNERRKTALWEAGLPDDKNETDDKDDESEDDDGGVEDGTPWRMELVKSRRMNISISSGPHR